MTTYLDKVVQIPHQGIEKLTAKDLKANIDVRWCSGCGGYAILNQTQKIMADLGYAKEKLVFISGIGCSSRFPYYMDIYGMHTMHGRALAIASGLSTARPDLAVWIATGDGDCMSIGGNHLIHAARRNVNLKILMFNNAVYSLTKGQYSPTSLPGQVTKSSPLGVLDDPFNPAALALGAGASFVARCYDRDVQMMRHIYDRAGRHNGFAFVESYANCVIFNDGAFDLYTKKETRNEHSVYLEHGKPLIFGNNSDKGIKLDGFTPVIVSLEDGQHSVNDLLVHNEKDATLAFILANMTYSEDLPRPMGVFQAIERPTYEQKVKEQIGYYQEKYPDANTQSLMYGEDSWELN